MRAYQRWCAALATSLFILLVSACDRSGPNQVAVAPPAQTAPEKAAPLKNEIPPDQLGPVLEAHLRGLGYMEQLTDYGKAVAEFRKVHQLAPGWIPGSINLAIALLNDAGQKNEQAKKAGGGPPEKPFEEAMKLLEDVIARDPENLHAHYTRGVILEYMGQFPDAHREFKFVTERDPTDAHAWLKLGSSLMDPENPNRQAGPKQAKELVEIYTKALERNPYLLSTLYKLQQSYGWTGDRAAQNKLLKLWRQLDQRSTDTGYGDRSDMVYGEMGRYASVVGPGLPTRKDSSAFTPPRFDPPAPMQISLPAGDRWAKPSDFDANQQVIGRVRARFGAALAVFDANSDGRLDLFLAAAVAGPTGVRDALLLNRGDGRFEDATAALGLPLDRASLGVAAGDFDADRRVDLFLTGVGDNRLFRNAGEKGFEDVTQAAGISAPAAVSLTARWLDLDHDGDLDLYVVNYTSLDNSTRAFTDQTPPGMPNSAFRNDGKPAAVGGRPAESLAPVATAPGDLSATQGLSIAFSSWSGAEALLGGEAPHTAIAALDIDSDRDLDLVLSADGAPATCVLNDRLGQFHTAKLEIPAEAGQVSNLLVLDFDKDSRPDIVAFDPKGRVTPWRNRTDRNAQPPVYGFDLWPTDAHNWRSALVADLDLDGSFDIAGSPAAGPEPLWARNEGTRLTVRPLGLGPETAEAPADLAALTVADLVGDPLPDLVLVGAGQPPRIARNLGNGHHWLELDLAGRWKAGKDHMRTNPEGLGARIWIEGQGLDVPYEHTTPEAGLGQSVTPIVLGLGPNRSVTLLHVLWPDGVLQAELNLPGDQVVKLPEVNRKTDSCPVLFTWNGERFVCIADFLGGGGLGYLLAPGIYSQPDRDEAVAIAPDQLRESGGLYRISITEPMDEVAYLDMLTLDVVDRPPGIFTAPDERFATTGPRPTGQLLAWHKTIEPARATDLEGHDLTETLRSVDRRTADGFRRLDGWMGYAEEHGIVLDFADRLAHLDPNTPLILCLAGWVEYPHSETNYAAATAGVVLQPPVLEHQRTDGTWELLDAHPGYPAGLPRLTTLDLTGKLSGPRCVIRLRTNMECYWDQAFLAVRDTSAPVRVTSLPVQAARLAYRGYTREVSPDGRKPLLYDYDYIDPAPLVRMRGHLTRYGDVASLLRADHDELCLVGPGDEARIEFDAGSVPALPAGWTRAYILRTVGYCKDSSPFTALSDTVEPLPWKGMPAFPFGPEGERPQDPVYKEYVRTFQTRPAGAQ